MHHFFWPVQNDVKVKTMCKTSGKMDFQFCWMYSLLSTNMIDPLCIEVQKNLKTVKVELLMLRNFSLNETYFTRK